MINTYASPAFPRPASSAIFLADLFPDGTPLSVAVEHRQRDEEEWTSAPFPEIRGHGAYATFIPEIREEYRWIVTIPTGGFFRVPRFHVMPDSTRSEERTS